MDNQSTLERLLRIQGKPQQEVTIETDPEKLEGKTGTDITPPAPPAPLPRSEIPTQSQTWKMPPDEREAWRVLFRFYEKYATRVRAAALMDDNNEAAISAFCDAADEMNTIYKERGIIGQAVAPAVYELLDLVFKSAKQG